MHLSLEEHGCYLKMLMISWRSPDCRIDADDARIATMLGVTKRRWTEKLRPSMEGFFDVDGTVWNQKRLQKEFIASTKRKAKHATKSSKGGKAKALKEKKRGLPEANGRQAVGTACDVPSISISISNSTEDTPPSSEYRAGTPFGHEYETTTWKLGEKVVGSGMVGKAIKAGVTERDVLAMLDRTAEIPEARRSAYFAGCLRDYEPTPVLSEADKLDIEQAAQRQRDYDQATAEMGGEWWKHEQ
tara:strand:- start:102 stop:833 length:732 start_codon:yes stop_codon:yes gene_type:complete